jgi:hypothetical protein
MCTPFYVLLILSSRSACSACPLVSGIKLSRKAQKSIACRRASPGPQQQVMLLHALYLVKVVAGRVTVAVVHVSMYLSLLIKVFFHYSGQ